MKKPARRHLKKVHRHAYDKNMNPKPPVSGQGNRHLLFPLLLIAVLLLATAFYFSNSKKPATPPTAQPEVPKPLTLNCPLPNSSCKELNSFKLLRQNMGRTVSKDEIFNVVWDPPAGGPEGATDWALDALIYRLRKHPFMKANNFVIESHKKVGYTLIQT